MTKKASESMKVSSVHGVQAHKTYPGYLIRRLHQISTSLFLHRMHDLAMTPLQYTILRIVARHPGWNQKMIATDAVLDTSTTHDIVQRLESKGFVTRNDGIKDRRMREVFLTENGRQALGAAERVVLSAQSELLKPLPRTEHAAFLSMLAVLIEAHESRSDDSHPGPWRRHAKGA